MRHLFPIFLTLLLLTGLSASAAPETHEFGVENLSEVAVENTSGKVSVLSTDTSKASVVVNKIKFTDQCKLTVEKVGKKISVIVGRAKIFTTASCEADVEVRLPKSVQTGGKFELEFQVGAGTIVVSEVDAELDFKIGSGSIEANGNFRAVDGFTGSGNINVSGMTGDGNLKTGSGNINLRYAKVPQKGEVDVKVGSGNAKMEFPKGSKVRTSFKAAAGDLTNELGDTPKSDFRVSMRAGAGSLHILTY